MGLNRLSDLLDQQLGLVEIGDSPAIAGATVALVLGGQLGESALPRMASLPKLRRHQHESIKETRGHPLA
jgi:hypothetical protein